MKKQYTREFFTKRQELARRSARDILHIVFSHVRPTSVIDLGCGTGTWLSQCERLGVRSYLGVDGDWVDRDLLEIKPDQFVVHNLETEKYRPQRRYDCAICVEVAEHLSPEMGEGLIQSLIEASDIVLFSAAIKGQGGTGHINEQPQRYWASKFLEHNYICVDLVRPNVWENDSVNVIYKQNMLLYVTRARCRELGLNRLSIDRQFDLDRVHPDLFFRRSVNKNGIGCLRWLRSAKRIVNRGA